MFMTPQACLEAGTEYPRYKLFVGFDVGKRFHAAHARTGSGRRVLALKVDNDEAAVDAFVARALEAADCEPGACLVVVDQRRNIGTVVVRRALAAGCDVAYITGKREKKARELFPGVAKNDAKDAEVIAAAAAGMPQSLLPVPREDDGLEGARRLRSQLAFSVKQSTQVKNRIRAALVESNAAFERLVDFSRPWQLDVLEKLGGPWQVLDAGKGRLARVARDADEEELAGLWESLSRATRPTEEQVAQRGAHHTDAGQEAPRDRGRRRRALRPGGEGGRGRRDLPVPPHRAGRRALHCRPARRGRAGRRVRRQRQARELLRADAARHPVGRDDKLDVPLARGQPLPQEPAHLHVPLPGQVRQRVREVLQGLPVEGHEAHRGAEGDGPQEAEGDLRGHARREALRAQVGRA